MAVSYKEKEPSKAKGQKRERKKGKLEPVEAIKEKKSKAKAKAKTPEKKAKTKVKAKISKTKTKDKEVIEDKLTEEVIEPSVDALLGSVSFSLGTTRQARDETGAAIPFEFIRLDISVTKPCGTTEDELNEALEFVGTWIDSKMTELTSEDSEVQKTAAIEVEVEDEDDSDYEEEDEESEEDEEEDEEDEDEDEDEEDEPSSTLTMTELREEATEAIDNHGKKFALECIVGVGGKDKGTVRKSLATVEASEYEDLVLLWQDGPQD